MKTSSAKAKGRRLVLFVKEWLLSVYTHLESDDVSTPAGSSPGEDIKLSPLARKAFPFSVECKAQEGISKVYGWVEQAKTNSNDYTPIVIARSNRKEALVIMTLNDFETIIGVKK